MLGFKPRAHQAQNYAEGGLVRGLVRRVMGIPEPTPDPAPAAAAPAAPAAAPPPAPAPAPAKAISDYSGMGAMKRREAAAGLKNGGPVEPKGFRPGGGPIRGPGTGTSDSIPKEIPEGSYIMPADSTAAIGDQALQGMGKGVPVNVSNGEHELPPEQVHAIGVQALDQMKAATHTPVAEQGAQGAQGFKPELFFADGGDIEDPLKRRPTYEATPAPTSWKPPGTRGMNDVMGDAINTVSQAGQPRVLPTMSGAAPTGNAGIQYAPGPVPPKAQATGQNLDGPRVLPTMNGAAPTGTPGITYERGFAPGSARGPAPEMLGNGNGNSFGDAAARANGALASIAGGPHVLPTLSGAPPTGNPGITYERGFAPTSARGPGPSMLGNSFGDAAAASSSPGTVQQPATASAPTAPAAPTATPAAAPTTAGAVSAANDAALKFGGFPLTPEQGARAGQKFDQDQRDMAAGAASGFAPAYGINGPGANPVALPGGASPVQGGAGAGRGSVNPPMANPGAPAPRAPVPDADLAAASGRGPGPGDVKREGNSYSGANVSGLINVNGRDGGGGFVGGNGAQGFNPGATPNADAVIAASTRLNQGAGTIGPADYANRNAGFNNEAALRTAGARGSWSPRNGFQSDAGAIQAAELPMRQAAELEQTAMRTQSAENISAQNNAGEIQRTTIRDAGDTARNNTRASVDIARDSAHSGIAQGQLALQQEAQGFQSAAARQIQGLQQKYLASKDPAEQAKLAQQIREYQGKEPGDKFAHSTGGQQVDGNGVAYKVPDVIYNKQTGEVMGGGAPRGAATAPLPNHVDALKKNPKQAAQFDQIYGAGAAARILGTK